jgi:signal transduction histidine kinase
MQDQAQVKGCRIAYALREIPPIHGFEELLRSAVFNLLDNAIKYSYNGMEISAVLRESPDGRILISVENLGVGIPEGDREAVFKPYYRARVPDARGARTGSGIGLAIVKHAVEIAHGGKVKAESTPVKRIEPGKTAEEIAPHLHKTIFKVTLSRDKMGAEWNPSAP